MCFARYDCTILGRLASFSITRNRLCIILWSEKPAYMRSECRTLARNLPPGDVVILGSRELLVLPSPGLSLSLS